MAMKRISLAVASAALAAAPALAQDGGLAASCAGLPAEARETCVTVAQAAESTQPQLGILLAGGNPVLGTASTSGVRLGILPRVTAGVRLNVVGARVPDIIVDDEDGSSELGETIGVPAPALGGYVAVGLTQGFTLGPTVGGFGAIDLLGSATWLPFRAFEVEGFEEAPEIAFGVGARVGLLRESFVTPGVSVSVMYRRLGEASFGEVCRGEEVEVLPAIQVDQACVGDPGDLGELRFDLTNWSYRGVVSKRLLGLGLAAGVGYDRYESDVSSAFRYQQPPATIGGAPVTMVRRGPEVTVENDRWSAFGNASFTVLVGTITLEGGWMQGGDTIEGFPSGSDFDPEDGNFFGSLGVRLSL